MTQTQLVLVHSLYLFRLGLAPQIHDLFGKVDFTGESLKPQTPSSSEHKQNVFYPDEEINNVKRELDKYGIQMPAFHKIGGILANELSVDQAAGEWRRSQTSCYCFVTVVTETACVWMFSVHAAVIAINEAVDGGRAEVTARTLKNPSAMLDSLHDALMEVYQELLQQSKRQKARNAKNRVTFYTRSAATFNHNITHCSLTANLLLLQF